MRGLFLEAGKLRLRCDLPEPAPVPGETRVRVISAGVCATDLALVRGYMNFHGVLGHEFCGEALEGPLAGKRVVGEINAGCGACSDCAAGDPRHCASRTVLGILSRDGAFAEQLRLPTRNLHPIPTGLSAAAATFTEPVAAALRVPEALDLGQVQRALVVGDGRLGLLLCRTLERELSCGVEIAGRHPERASLVPDCRWHGPVGEPSGPPQRAFDLVLEASGRPEVLQAALECVRPRGTLVLKTTSERPVPLDLAGMVVDEIRIIGSRCGPFERALEVLATGRVQVEDLIQTRFPLAEGVSALEAAARPGALKVLIEFDE